MAKSHPPVDVIHPQGFDTVSAESNPLLDITREIAVSRALRDPYF
jgi:hypothetical protein